jgi:AraC-like DNA-binding protein
MYSASFVRKKMLWALEEFILPAVSNRVVSHLLAEPPFDFSGIEHRVLATKPLPDITPDPRQIFWSWPRQKMVCTQSPFLVIVFDGSHDTRLGLTEELAKRQSAESRAGIYALRLIAPFSLYFPSMVPRGDGSPFEYRPLKAGEHKSPVGLLLLHLFPDEALVGMHVSNDKETFGTHPLQIKDRLLAQSGLLYADELRHGGEAATAQFALSIMMNRLWRYLKARRMPLGNSSWPTPDSVSPAHEPPSPHAGELCSQIMDYVQTHLDHKLSREVLAARFKVSAVHLNRLFLRTEGVSVMRYVTLQRINAAKAMLSKGNESIEDIAHFVGFANGSSFGTVFRRCTGKSPRAFRKEAEENTSK